MRLVLAVVLAVALLASLTGVVLAGTGNGAPSGPHYNLNIIGVTNPKDAMGDKVGGHVIFVELNSSHSGRVRTATDILLFPDNDPPYEFYVMDGNGTDDGEASFQMPFDVADTYTVWVRGLGKPGGNANVQLCAWDPVEEEYVCSTGYTITRPKGQRSFVNVTNELLKIDGVSVFDPVYEGYFWSYANNGLKLAQLRFYPNP